MTNKEAKRILQFCICVPMKTDEQREALNLAIKALEERPTGEWITVHYAREELNCPEKSMLDFVKCPFCETIHQGRHNFCSRCGADMRGDNNG